MQGPRRPLLFHVLVAFLGSAAGAVGLWAGVSQQWTWQAWLLCWIAGVNVIALIYYAYDKSRAKRTRSRVPEVVLHGLALAGGSVGAFVGMYFFRHKTVKGRFQLIFWGIVLLQAALVAHIVRELFF